jgi:DNA-binding PadR family transcriptional regulator
MDGDLRGLGRFSEPALLVLTSLASGPKHGYAMIQDIEQIYGVELGAGTLYAAIARLEQRGLIEALPAEERRRPYQLTNAGAEVLHAQLAHLQQFVTIGLQRLAQP